MTLTWSVAEDLEQFGIPAEGLALLRRGIGATRASAPTISSSTRAKPTSSSSSTAAAARSSGGWGQTSANRPTPPPHACCNTSYPAPWTSSADSTTHTSSPKACPAPATCSSSTTRAPPASPPARLGIFAASRVLEIDPISLDILWQYTGEDSGAPAWTFHSSFISSARRLPNGNTLIDEGQNGRIFQVTPRGKIVWEYVNPHFGTTIIGSREVRSNWVFRAQPVPYEWVPEGTGRSEAEVKEIDVAAFRVPR